MPLNRNWVSLPDSAFVLTLDEQSVGTLYINSLNNGQTTCILPEGTFFLSGRGFWNHHLEVTDQEGRVVLDASATNWFSNQMKFTYDNRFYILQVRNNPLAEWVILEGPVALLTYGLGSDGQRPEVYIKVSDQEVPYLFDFLLWYLFWPVAQEQMAGEMVFRTVRMK